MAVELHDGLIVREEQTTAQAPERLSRRWRSILAAGDAAVVLFVSLIALSAAPNPFAAAIVMAAAICGTFWLCDMYARSYAVYPRDEAYYACAGVLYATPLTAIVLAAVGQISIGSIALAVILSAFATSVWRIRMHLQRRGGSPPYAGLRSITPRGWHDRESAGYLLTKRCFDVAVAATALIVTFPLMVAAAIAIVVESGMPVLFKQQRAGRDVRPFVMFKFRTMRADADGQWARPGDSRITRVGALLRRTSIDELPQLFNVLRGDMSIVGPRPEMVDFAREFSQSMPSYDQRHVVLPGITGWAQVYHKRNLQPDDMKDVLPYDLFYVERSSVLLDTAILLKTIVEVLFHRAV